MKRSHPETGRNDTRVLLAAMLLLALAADSHAATGNGPGQQQPTSIPDADREAEAVPAREPAEVVIPEAMEPPAEASPAESPPAGMNLASLKHSLRKSRAIGFFTKLELKRQVDDLVRNFGDYHRNRNDLSLDQLKERFSLLLMKLLVLLQDDDPELHHDIAGARSALWETLADPAQFAVLKGI